MGVGEEVAGSVEKSLLIKQVVLVDQSGKGEPQTVNLLIKQGRLKLVTVDAVPSKMADRVVDAQLGYILGRLDVGKPVSFMILDQNPLENFDALLDTKTHAVFVMREGRVVRNRLLPASTEPKVSEKKEGEGWFAYSTPPIVLPTSYQNTKKWNRFQSKYVDGLFVGAVMLDRMGWLTQNDDSVGQVGDLTPYDGGEIRALRVGVVGTFNFETPWIYTLFVATHAFDQGFDSADNKDDLTLFDLRLDIPLLKNMSIAIGKQKEPISMERLMSLSDLPLQERSAVSDAMMPSRNTGIVLSGTGFDRRFTWAGGVFNPWIDQGNTISESATQLIGRGTVVALVSTDESSLVHLGAGVRYSNAKKAVQYRTTPEFHQAPLFVDTGEVLAENTMLYDLEAAWRWGPFWLNGEYVINQVDASSFGDPMFNGFHVTASYVLTGEMRPYNKHSGLFRPVPVANPVTQGGWGAWEVAARFSALDLQEGAVDGGDMDIYSLGINWKLTSVTSFNVNYRHVILDQNDATGHSDGLMMRVTLILE